MLLFGFSPQGDQMVEYMDVYLNAARSIPADVYAAACALVLSSWDDRFSCPRPIDIKRCVSEITRSCDEALAHERRLQQRREAMTPSEAKELLVAITEKPKPRDDVGIAVRAVQVEILQRAARRPEPAVLPEHAMSAEDF